MDDRARHNLLRYFAYGPYYDPVVLEGNNALAREGVRLLVDLQSHFGCQEVVEDHLAIGLRKVARHLDQRLEGPPLELYGHQWVSRYVR